MAPQDQNPPSFWDFVQSLDPGRAPGLGVDHCAPALPPGFLFGAPGSGWGPRAGRGPGGHDEACDAARAEKPAAASPDTADGEPPEAAAEKDAHQPPPKGGHGHGRARCSAASPFDLASMFFQPRGPSADSFTPPVDVFDTEAAFVVHAALPGVGRGDLGVSWDPDAAGLRVAGVVHRPGDELFLAALAAGERRVGLFDRLVRLPPPGSDGRVGVDAARISAKLDDGLLVVVLPKLDKEWSETRQVDVE